MVRSFIRLFGVLSILFALGCAQKSISLQYHHADANRLTPVGAKTLCVVAMADVRSSASIGQTREGADIYTEDDVRFWFNKAVAARMADLGFLVTHAETMEAAVQSNADYILTGEIHKVWLKETSLTSYEAQLSLFVTLRGRTGAIFTNTMNSSSSQTVIPVTQKPDQVLKAAMRNLMETLALFVKQKTQ